MYGVNTILLGVFPLRFARANRASFVSGLLDFCSYVAAGLSSVFSGLVIQLGLGWNSVFLVWLVLTVMGIGAWGCLGGSTIEDNYSEWRFSAKAGGAVLGSNTKFLYKMSVFFTKYFTICINDGKIQMCKRLHTIILNNYLPFTKPTDYKGLHNSHIFK